MFTTVGDKNIGSVASKFIANVFKSLNIKPSFAQFIAGDKNRKIIVLLAITLVAGALVTLAYVLGSNKEAATEARTQQFDSKLAAQKAKNDSSTSSQINNNENPASSDQASSSATNSSSTTVTVNGKSVNVPANGSYSQTTEDPSGNTTTISGENSHTNSAEGGSASNNSSTTININSKGD
jgi:hypothetical protein